MRERKEERPDCQEETTRVAEGDRREPQEPAAPADSSLLPTGNAAPDPAHPPEKPTRSSAA